MGVLERVSPGPGNKHMNMVSLAQMTITARTASKLCARSRSEYDEIFVPRCDISGKFWNLPTWTECQLELCLDLQRTKDMSWN